MQLFKKTIILTGGDVDGAVSAIRVGDDVGIKITLNNFERGMKAGVKIGDNDAVFFELTGDTTEKPVPPPFYQNDSIGCVVFKDDRVVAKGGKALPSRAVSDFLSHGTGEKKTAPAMAEDATDGEFRLARPDGDEGENCRAEFLEALEKKDGAEFYNGVRKELEELFVIYPKEENLNGVIPNSDWVRINYEKDGHYVVGKITENGRVVLLGYGVPGKKRVQPPKIAKDIATWLAVDGLSADYDGYWLMFQDAATGKVVPAE